MLQKLYSLSLIFTFSECSKWFLSLKWQCKEKTITDKKYCSYLYYFTKYLSAQTVSKQKAVTFKASYTCIHIISQSMRMVVLKQVFIACGNRLYHNDFWRREIGELFKENNICTCVENSLTCSFFLVTSLAYLF